MTSYGFKLVCVDAASGDLCSAFVEEPRRRVRYVPLAYTFAPAGTRLFGFPQDAQDQAMQFALLSRSRPFQLWRVELVEPWPVRYVLTRFYDRAGNDLAELYWQDPDLWQSGKEYIERGDITMRTAAGTVAARAVRLVEKVYDTQGRFDGWSQRSNSTKASGVADSASGLHTDKWLDAKSRAKL